MDPGLDKPIEHAAQDIQSDPYAPGKPNDSDGSADSNNDGLDQGPGEFLSPSRWWFASTAIPLVAACFGPIASAFNICALASHWRVSIPSGLANDTSDMIDIDDPRWLLGINAVSLAIAIISNLALLLNMARRVPFRFAQPVTIVGWYVSSGMLIGLVVAANKAPGMQLADGMNRTLTQAYYYALWAAILYFVITSLMVVTVWGALRGHYEMDFQLTISQRSLMLQTTSYVVYLLAGAAVWHKLEGWSFTDAVYWANYTLLTIGLGNLTPSTHAGRSLLFPYAVGGIIILGLVISSIRTLMLERGKRKLSARMAERMRQKAVRQMYETDGKIRLGTKGKTYSMDSAKSHQEQRRQEFTVMRRIQEQADSRRKWTALLASTIAGFILWFMGALVFWKTEEVQGWTYFTSLYMCYVSLLSIGYGDTYPQTNAGKSFYVFWSLLAVPTLTILISNMGDTVVRLVKDATLWLGELTILPGSDGLRGRVKQLISRQDPESSAEQTHATEASYQQAKSQARGPTNLDPRAVARRNAAIEREELAEAESARRRGDPAHQHQSLYRFLLIREIRRVMDHLGSEPARKYSYDEWAWFLRLLGEAEDDEDGHQAPPRPEDVVENARGREQVGRNRNVKWSWLGERSPLLGETDEPEWVLERLTLRLEEELEESSRAERRKRRGEMEGEGDRGEKENGKENGKEDRKEKVDTGPDEVMR